MSNQILCVLGCGLARLTLEYAAMDYAAQGNEFSYYMLMSSNFILNCSEEVEQFPLQPFIHQFTNIKEEKDNFRVVRVPDVLPSDLVSPQSDLSMVAGEFIECYKD